MSISARVTLPADCRLALLEGLDETLLIRRSAAAIAGFLARERLARPWAHRRGGGRYAAHLFVRA